MMSRADSPTSICDGSMVESIAGTAADAAAKDAAAVATMPAANAASKPQWRRIGTLTSPIPDRFVRGGVGLSAGDRQTQCAPPFPPPPIEQFAGFPGAHLAGTTLSPRLTVPGCPPGGPP